MLLDSDDLSIRQLADTAGVSIRTIRFYQSQELLDAPGTRGLSATYGESDLKRLELIKALQRERFTLAEIKRRLQDLGPEEVVRELQSLAGNRKSAADYARSIRLAGHRPSALEGAAQRSVPGSAPRSRGTWERIALSPGVELHVRSPLSHRQTKLVSRLVELADRLINTQEGV